MNDKENTIYKVLDAVVGCCSMDIDGVQSVTREDVLGKSKKSNAVMTRAIYVTEMLFLGYTTETIAMVLHRTEKDIRHLLNSAHQFRISSYAYRVAEAEATLLCKDMMK